MYYYGVSFPYLPNTLGDKMKFFMIITAALMMVSTVSAKQLTDKNTVECVEVVKDPMLPTCKALTVGCIGGWLLQVNDKTVDGFVKSPIAAGQCAEAKDLALDIIDNKELIQDVMLNHRMTTNILSNVK